MDQPSSSQPLGSGGLIPSAVAGDDQLPDESYIEKLFPKCPPKQLQQTRANNFQQNRSSFRQDGSTHKQQQKRQTRLRSLQQQRQQQHRTEALVDITQPSASGRAQVPNDKTLAESSRIKEQYNSSSESSLERDTSGRNAKGNYASSAPGVKRTSSNHYGFDTNNSSNQLDKPGDNNGNGPEAPRRAYGRQRTRKYTASKSLQQQLQRSQSGYKLDPRPPPTEVNGHRAQKRLSSPDQNEISLVEPVVPTTSVLQPSTSTSSMIKSQAGDNLRVNRTCRGIVFSKPLPSSGNDNDHRLSTPAQAHILDELPNGEDLDAIQSSSLAPKAAQLAQVTPLPSPPLLTQPKAQKHSCETADSEQQPPRADINSERSSHVSNTTSLEPLTDPSASSTLLELETGTDTAYQRRSIPDYATPDQIVEFDEKTSDNNKPADPDVEDQLRDEDKYINLFVYDNSTPQGKLNDEINVARNQVPQSSQPKTPQPKSAASIRYVNRAHGLLAEDLSENEQDVIRNDTSVEELCGVNDDNDPDPKLQPETHRDYRDSVSKGADLSSNELSLNRPPSQQQQQNHRSIGLLQTVDEKAEINNEEAESLTGGIETTKSELIDISENGTMLDEDNFKMIKKGGLAPPGFPRRVRPTVASRDEDHSFNRPDSSHPQRTTGNDSQPPQPSSNDNKAGPSSAREAELRTTGKTEQEPLAIAEGTITTASRPVVNNIEYSESALPGALNKLSLESSGEQPDLSVNNNQRQHHKLPNETSHFSIARLHSKPQVASLIPEIDPPRAGLQFNTLSDAESDPDAQPSLEPTPSGPAKTKITTDRQFEPSQIHRPSNSTRPACAIDNDLSPGAKTALVFPRLDEGLSSEAESCDDEAEEEDDRAMEADVDENDNNEEEEDDDASSPTLTHERDSLSSGIDPAFLRFAQNQPKSQNCLLGNFPQHSGGPSLMGSAETQIKTTTGLPYGNFMQTHDAVDQNDLKSAPNYANHNGQNNYWPSTSTQQPMSTQPSTSQNQFNLQRSNISNGNNLNLTRPNDRDEVKTSNRLSSDTDNETDRLLGSQRNDQLQRMNNNELISSGSTSDRQGASNLVGRHSNSREVLIEGVLFGVKYLGSTHTECGGLGDKDDRIRQAEQAVEEVKFRNGDAQSPAEVQLFISTEKVMVLDDKRRRIIMDHSIRTIAYVADVGQSIVLIVGKRGTSGMEPRPSCHVFESQESHVITKSMSQAFQVAFAEKCKANGVDSSNYLPRELDYQEVLNSQEMSMTELEMFARKDNQREVIVPKKKGEILGLSIVESGWGSVLPTAVIAGLQHDGPAERCKKLSIGDQILSINGVSLVGLSLADCQKILRKTKDQSVARLSVVPCPITVEVKIKRPDTKYQLGFSVQHGVICSLLRGGIAERGGVRVGHRIISINGTGVVGVPHDKIVTLLASSVGEIRMKTCLTSLYRQVLGEEKNVSFV